MLSSIFHIFKYALGMLLEQKQTVKHPVLGGQSHKRWARLCAKSVRMGANTPQKEKVIQEPPTLGRLCIGLTQRQAPGKMEAVKVQKWSQWRIISWAPSDVVNKEGNHFQTEGKDSSREQDARLGICSSHSRQRLGVLTGVEDSGRGGEWANRLWTLKQKGTINCPQSLIWKLWGQMCFMTQNFSRFQEDALVGIFSLMYHPQQGLELKP